MSEPTTETTASVSDKEIKDIETKIVKEENDKLAKVREEAMAEARKELAKEMEFKKLQEEKALLEATIASQTAERKKMSEAFKKKESEYKAQMGDSKGNVHTQNPFGDSSITNTKFDANNLTQEQIRDIDEASGNAWFESQGIGSDWKPRR